MLAASELRIGNWVRHDERWSYRNDPGGKEFNFQWEDRDWYAIGECTLDFDVIHPIPLTPEILMKCQFGYSYRTVFHDGSGHDTYCYAGSFHILMYENGECEYNKFTRFKYLHQLQNLFFAIRQEELTYNPIKK